MNDSYTSGVYGLNRSLNSQSTHSQRKFSKLDGPVNRPAEYTTMFSQTHRTSTLQAQSGDGYSPHPGSVVIEAFKDLQRKVKSMEEERYQACSLRDELKSKLAMQKRDQHLVRSKTEYEAAEALIHVRSFAEQTIREKEELESRVRTTQEVQDSIQRKLSAQRGLVSSLQEDVDRNRSRILAAEKQNLLLERELKVLSMRRSELDFVKAHSPEKHASQQQQVLHSVSGLEKKIARLRRGSARTRTHILSLEAYIALLVKVNGDLVETLQTREKTLASLLRQAFSPPRYAWPKDVSYPGMIKLLNEATAAHGQAMLEGGMGEVGEEVMKSILRSVSPPKRRRSLSPHKSPARSRSAASLERTSLSQSQGLAQGQGGVSRSMSFSSPAQAGRGLSYLQDEGAPTNGHAAHTNDAAAQAEDGPGNMAEDSDDSDSDYVPPRREKKKSKKSKKRSDAAPLTARSTLTFPTYTVRSNPRTSTLNRSVRRQGAVRSATRLAAAAQALSTSVRISPPRQRAGEREAADKADAGNAARVSEVDFIPSGGGREFNIIASVSKASRAARYLNATIASRVKSLHQGGVGKLFGEVPHISMKDLSRNLKEARKINGNY